MTEESPPPNGGETPSLPAAPPPPAASGPPGAPPWWPQPPRKKSWLKRILLSAGILLFVMSIIMNIELLVLMAAGRMRGLKEIVIQDGKKNQVVAVYTVQGLIDDKTAADFKNFYRILRNDKNIKAVVIRIVSGGGGVSASDRIYRMVGDIREELHKPVMVSMGAVAASGGYYIAAPANQIYAEPTTTTGSIGVVAVWPVLKGLMDKHGVEIVTIRSSQSQRWKIGENFWETPEKRIRQNVRQMLDMLHIQFADAVAQGRGKRLVTRQVEYTAKDDDGKEIKLTETEPLNGRAYLADEAKELGLIDEIGYLEDATAAAARKAKLTKPKIVRYVRPRTIRERLGFSGAPVSLDVKTFDRMMTPRIMMVWKAE